MEPQNSPTPQRSLVLPILIAVIVTALVVGGLVYYVTSAMNQTSVPAVTPTPTTTATLAPITATATPTVTVTPATNQYTNTNFGFVLTYPKDWKIVRDSIQKSKTAESNPGEDLTLAPVAASLSDYHKGENFTVIVKHGGFGPEVSHVSYTATYKNGKVTLSDKQVNDYDGAFAPPEETFDTYFTANGVQYFMKASHLTDSQFKEIAESFTLNYYQRRASGLFFVSV